jgi:sugar phosphate isomerase/epimerase
MARPITLFTGQWADLPFEEVCRLAADWGYDGLEIACWGDHFDVDRALSDDSYVERKRETLAKYQLKVWAISNHLVGQAVCDHPIDERPRPSSASTPSSASPAHRSGTPWPCSRRYPRR